MPRQPRLDAPGALHHVMGRGIERTNIFRTDRERDDFLERLAGFCGEENLLVYALYFGVTTSSVNRLSLAKETEDLIKYLKTLSLLSKITEKPLIAP